MTRFYQPDLGSEIDSPFRARVTRLAGTPWWVTDRALWVLALSITSVSGERIFRCCLRLTVSQVRLQSVPAAPVVGCLPVCGRLLQAVMFSG